MTCLSQRSVYEQVKALKIRGVLSVKAGGGRGHSNGYTVNVTNPEPNAPFSVNPEPHSVNGMHKTLNHMQRNPEPCSPELYREVTMKGAPVFKTTRIKQIETARHKRNGLFRKYALENSLIGTQWRSAAAKRDYDQLGKQIREWEDELTRSDAE